EIEHLISQPDPGGRSQIDVAKLVVGDDDVGGPVQVIGQELLLAKCPRYIARRFQPVILGPVQLNISGGTPLGRTVNELAGLVAAVYVAGACCHQEAGFRSSAHDNPKEGRCNRDDILDEGFDGVADVGLEPQASVRAGSDPNSVGAGTPNGDP